MAKDIMKIPEEPNKRKNVNTQSGKKKMKSREVDYVDLVEMVREQGRDIKRNSKEIQDLKNRISMLRDSFAKIISTKFAGTADLERVGNLIQKYRLIRQLSQSDLATLADSTQKTISQLELGKVAKPRKSTLSNIFRSLDIPPDEIASEIWASEKETA